MFTWLTKKEDPEPEQNNVSSLNHPLEKKKLNPLDARLLKAVNRGDVASVKNYLARGADVNCHQFNRATPLAIAAERDNEVMAHVLLSQPKVDVNFQDMEGDSPLHIAVKSGQSNVAKLLLHFGADVNSPDPMGRTPLHTAVFERNIEMAKCLIHHGAKVNATDTFGELPLHIALLYQPCPHTARLLMRNGSQPNARNIPGLGVINETALSGDEAILVKIVYMLVHQGASVNVYEPIGKRTPLHLAAFTNNVELAEYLLSVGADVNAQTKDGRTPLALALCFRSWDVADVIERHMLAHQSTIREENDEDSDSDEKVALISKAITMTLQHSMMENIEQQY